jgi:hypothetical protein
MASAALLRRGAQVNFWQSIHRLNHTAVGLLVQKVQSVQMPILGKIAKLASQVVNNYLCDHLPLIIRARRQALYHSENEWSAVTASPGRNVGVIGSCLKLPNVNRTPRRRNAVGLIYQANGAAHRRLCNGDRHMRFVRSGWPRALSVRRFVLLATVAGIGVGGATFGTSALHQGGFATYAATR